MVKDIARFPRMTVAQLADGGLVEVGSHSVTHSVLSLFLPTPSGMKSQTAKLVWRELLAIGSRALPIHTAQDRITRG